MMIPPVYILITVACADVKTRAKYLGRIPTWSPLRRGVHPTTRPQGHTEERDAEIVSDVSYFGTMMVHLGMADGMVCGRPHPRRNASATLTNSPRWPAPSGRSRDRKQRTRNG